MNRLILLLVVRSLSTDRTMIASVPCLHTLVSFSNSTFKVSAGASSLECGARSFRLITLDLDVCQSST